VHLPFIVLKNVHMKHEYDFLNYETINNKELKIRYPAIHFALNRYYPVGLKALSEEYSSFIGYKSLVQLIVRNIEHPEYMKKQWDDGFLKELSSVTGFSVEGATYGYAPNFGGRIVLEQSNDLRYSTSLCFYYSFIHNFYSIHIEYSDKFITYQRNHLPNTTAQGNLKLMVSPVKGEYQELFNQVEKLMCVRFNNPKFIPFRFDITKLKDFETPTSVSLDFSTPISDAFFHKCKLLNGGTEIIGDVDYRMDEISM